MRKIIGGALIALGAALLGWTAYSTLRPAAHYTLAAAPAPAEAAKELESLGLPAGTLQRIEISSPEQRRPVATGLALRDGEGRLAPIVWRNEVTEPVFFADVAAADATKVLAAIREHVPDDAVVLAWWDFSRAIRAAAKRAAPLDDSEARGLLIPAAWPEAREAERARWSHGAPPKSAVAFGQFIDALTADEKQGAAALARLADGKPAYVAVHISDVWKAAAVKPDRLSIAYKDFAATGVSHGVIKSAQQWMRENRVEGGFAVEPTGGATRLHYFERKGDSDALIAKLLPFSTSNPMQLERLELVYQHKGWWIYRIKE